MKWVTLLIFAAIGCGPHQTPATSPSESKTVADTLGPDTLANLHVRLEVNARDGAPQYFGWYDGGRNLLGRSGIVSGIVGMETPELTGKLVKMGDTLRFAGVDQNRIGWLKQYTLGDTSVSVIIRVTNLRDEAFDAIVYSLADLPEGIITGDNRIMQIKTPIGSAIFRTQLDNPDFPGEQMSPYAMRSESKRLEPGTTMEFKMTWEMVVQRAGRPQ